MSGPTLLFSFPSARLTKSIPAHKPPPHVNGKVPRDATGLGVLPPHTSDVILADMSGPLSLSAVPDALSPQTTQHLVLSLGLSTSDQGAARTHVLPFRACTAPGNAIDLTANPTRPTYLGLGAGQHGQDGGSFWFFEDPQEEGAQDRIHWEAQGVGKRAIWTVWLLSAPAPVVSYLQNVLGAYPIAVPAPPHELLDGTQYPWRDTYLALPNPSSVDSEGAPSHASPGLKAPRPLPVIPAKPSRLRASSRDVPLDATSALRNLRAEEPISRMRPSPLPTAQSSPSGPTAVSAGDEALIPASRLVDSNDEIREETDALNSSVGIVPTLSPVHDLRTESPLTRQGAQVEENSVDVPFDTARSMERILRARQWSAYRHSLVAVDNETGEVVGVLAEDVHLDADADDSAPEQVEQSDDYPAKLGSDSGSEDSRGPITPAAATDGFNAFATVRTLGSPDADAENEVKEEKPLYTMANIGRRDVSQATSVAESESRDVTVTPRAPSILRAAAVYRDDTFEPSRPPSILGEDTFAPPPLPGKALQSPSNRSSVASAMFFSAAENATDDEDETDMRAMLDGFTSIGARQGEEGYQPGLLRDRSEDGAESDASGSTVGGPAVRLWRKALGKKKKKPTSGAGEAAEEDESDALDAARRRDPSTLSDRSVRTSRAETAMEADDEDDNADPKRASVHSQDPLRGDASQDDSEVEDETDTVTHLREPTAPADRALRIHGHQTRALLRTEEIRSVEDSVWREALEAGSLPPDAPYTHLAARGLSEAGDQPKSSASAPQPEEEETGDAGEMELLAPGEAQVRARARGKKEYMQGGTVLVEFLAGSRIGASIIRAGDAAASVLEVATSEDADAPPAAVPRTGALSLIPILPVHFLAWLGIADEKVAAVASVPNTPSVATTVTRARPTLQTSFLEDFSRTVWDGVTGWGESATGWLRKSTAGITGATAKSGSTPAAVADEPEEWEYVIPNFDPTSLASTPRPVYRRKRPVPSFGQGFSLTSGPSQDVSAPSTEVAVKSSADPLDVTSTPTPRPARPSAIAASHSARYSIIHFDGSGVGRRAFVRNLPSGHGLSGAVI